MGVTPNYNWPLPELTDPPDGPAQFKALGNAIDATVKGYEPSNVDVTTGFVVQTGWTVAWSYGRVGKVGPLKLCTFGIIANRTGAAITASSTGNITDSNVVQVPDTLTPWADWYGTFSTNGVAGTFVLSVGKMLSIVDAYPTASIATGATIQIRTIYPLA
jgi:hypothetical protein